MIPDGLRARLGLYDRQIPGAIDSPSDNSEVTRTVVEIEGWAAAVSRVIEVEIFVDGRSNGTCVPGLERPDVLRRFPKFGSVARFSGFRCEIDLCRIPSSVTSITIVAVARTTDRRIATIATHRCQVGPAPIEGSLDDPVEGAQIREAPIEIRGWAAGRDGPVSEVEVFVNGDNFGRCRLGVDRPDVSERLTHLGPHALLSGFEHLIDVRPYVGDVLIEIRVHSLNGECVSLAPRFLRRCSTPEPGPPEEGVGLSSELEQMVASPVTDANHLHLLVVTHHLGLGGGQLWLSELLERCGAGVEFSCTVVAPRDGALRRVLEKRGINVHLLGEIPISNTREYGDRLAEFAIWVTARRFNAVLVNTFGAWFGADVARRLGLPCVWAIHESWPPEQFWSAAYPPDYVPAGVRESCMQALWNTKAVVFEAEATRRLFLHDTPPGAARVVPYGVNTREIDEYCATVSRARARELTNLPEDARVILVLGTVEPRKAQAVAAEAFAAVASRYPTAILALVGGSDNQYTKTLESYIQRMGLDRQIQLFPVVNEVFPWYRSADYLLCASDVESLPRSILEVMAFGVPVVATNVFGIPELISDGQNGFLFAPRSLAATIAALERALVQDSNTLASVSGHARELIHSRYDSIHYATQVRTLLEELARERATNPGDLLR